MTNDDLNVIVVRIKLVPFPVPHGGARWIFKGPVSQSASVAECGNYHFDYRNSNSLLRPSPSGLPQIRLPGYEVTALAVPLKPTTAAPANQTPFTMAAQEHYSLRWNDHQNQILLAFDALLQTKSLVDVTLVCADTSIRAHKVVLSACSPFFQRVFAENPCKHPVIVLKDFNGWVVQAIVDFMYRGEISVPQERLQTLIQAGESLQVRGLIDHPVTGNTPTPAASPDDFNGMLHSGREGSFKGETTFLNHKLMFTPQIFMDGARDKNSIMDNMCTSPMPRRKQARPRRRSGDFSPQNAGNGENPTRESEFDTENNKNFKNVDAEAKGSISKSSSVLSLDTAAEEPEDLCTKPLSEEFRGGDEVSGSAKRKRFSGPVRNDNDNEDDEAETEAPKRAASESSASASAKRASGNPKDASDENRIVLSLKDIRHFQNSTNDSQRAHHLMASRFLNQSPSSILKTMSAFNAAGGRLSPKSLNEAKFAALQFRGHPMDLAAARHAKFYGHKMTEDDDEEEHGNEEDEDDEEGQEKSHGNNEAGDGASAEENKMDREEGRPGSKDSRVRSRRECVEDNNNNSRLDLLMSMNGPNALLMDHMEFKHRQHLFQQQQQQHHQNGLDALKASHHLSHNRSSSSADLLSESRKSHNESTPGGRDAHNANHRGKDFSGTSPMSLPPPFNMGQPGGGDAHPPFPAMPSVSSLALTPPHSKYANSARDSIWPPPLHSVSRVNSAINPVSGSAAASHQTPNGIVTLTVALMLMHVSQGQTDRVTD